MLNPEIPQRRKGQMFKYLKMTVMFCFTVSMLNLLTLFACQKGYLSFIERLTARTSTEVIQFFGLPAVRSNTVIQLKNTMWVVNAECTAVFIMIIFCCLIAFYQTSLKSKIIGILVGLPIIFAANIIRLLLMAFIDENRPAYLSYFRDYMWQTAFIIMSVFIWRVWIGTVAKREAKTAVHD
jgi:archaeosortase B (VPXXXP-CTERM-specific)